MLKQSKIFRDNQIMGKLIMDSNTLERGKGDYYHVQEYRCSLPGSQD